MHISELHSAHKSLNLQPKTTLSGRYINVLYVYSLVEIAPQECELVCYTAYNEIGVTNASGEDQTPHPCDNLVDESSLGIRQPSVQLPHIECHVQSR